MGNNYRIRTDFNEDKNIRININQNFDFLEILSLKLKQEDVYTRFCADYGVVTGRVIVNGGYGIPNANVSIFIPLSEVDQNDVVISTLYPYKRIDQKNEDGYRYNLLPYKKEYGGHTPTGTFPDREDLLTRNEVLEVYEKYYKFTAKTNESGDFMIVGVPLGMQTIMMDLDLSNIGCFSLRPADLIRAGLAGPGQFNGNQFKSSTDIDSLPQIVNFKKDIDVTSFWGEEEICNIGITRVDFDLRELGIEIKPQAVFMGSIFSTSNEDFLRSSCKPKKDAGNLCDLVTGEGKILAIRQTIDYDSNGRPVLENFGLENGGDVIDENGTWLVEVPMNLDYVVTNEFGEQVISNDPSVGIPTKGKYRFRIQYQNESGMENDVMRGDYLVPNVKEWGWTSGNLDGPDTFTQSQLEQQQKSYAFSLDWNDYGDLTTTVGQQMVQEAINCEDRFYEFTFNKVYTVANFIDRWKWGFNRSRHLGIKEITDRRCTTTTNRFPVNDGVRNFDFIFFLFNLVITVLTPIFLQIIIIFHVLALIWPLIKLVIDLLIWLINVVIYGICRAIRFLSGGSRPRGGCNRRTIQPLSDENPFSKLSVPMMSYPDCEACPCEVEEAPPSTDQTSQSLTTTIQSENNIVLADINTSDTYTYSPSIPISDPEPIYETIRNILGGYPTGDIIKTPVSEYQSIKMLGYDVTLSQSLNLANLRQRYFDGENRIRTTVSNSTVSQYFEDSVLFLFAEPGTLAGFNSGELISFVDPTTINDPNLNFTTGTTQTGATLVQKQVTWVDTTGAQQTSNLLLKLSANTSTYKYIAGIEYFQIITGGTVSQFQSELATSGGLLNKYLYQKKQKISFGDPLFNTTDVVYPLQQILNYQNYEIIFLTRGVDPYTEKQTIKYDLSPLFGKAFGQGLVVQGEYYLNIPIRQNSGSGIWFNNQETPQTHDITTNDLSSNLYTESFSFSVDSNMFSAFTNNSPHFYNSTDKTQALFKAYNTDVYSLDYFTNTDGVDSHTTYVGANNLGPNTITFDEDNNILTQGNIEGGTLIASNVPQGSFILGNSFVRVFSPAYHNQTPSNITINDSQLLVFRSDRLPTSDSVEVNGNNSFSLHLNSNFTYYRVDSVNTITLPSGISTVTDNTGNSQDFTGDTPSVQNSVLSTFSCEGMVPLKCYDYDTNGDFIVKNPCDENDPKIVKGGCYVLVQAPYVVSIPKDIKNFAEWKARFRMMFGACRGVFSHVFQNNWVNGTLYMYSFKKKTIFSLLGQPKKYKFCGTFDSFFRPGQGPIYYTEGTTNSLFYRSTPYDGTNFIGQTPRKKNISGNWTPIDFKGTNDANIFFPTTLMDLGSRDEFVKEICFNPELEAYYVNSLKSTTFNETSDILQLFFVSRLISSSFLQNIIGSGDASINQLFSRSEDRMDGDVVQMFSINSEYGVIPFSEDDYEDPNDLYVPQGSPGSSVDPLMGIFFSSNTATRGLVSPGVTVFAPTLVSSFGYPKSQEVPMYKWYSADQNTIFGNELNDWFTTPNQNIGGNGFFSEKYQNLNFIQSPFSPYFNNGPTGQKGHIFNTDSAGVQSATPWPASQSDKYIVGAPYHFYFGLNVGKTAINRYITKYILNV